MVSTSVTCAAETKAYRYEKVGVPRKGAYMRRPKLRPKLGMPQMEETRDGLYEGGLEVLVMEVEKNERSRTYRTVKADPYARPAPILYTAYQIVHDQILQSGERRGEDRRTSVPKCPLVPARRRSSKCK